MLDKKRGSLALALICRCALCTLSIGYTVYTMCTSILVIWVWKCKDQWTTKDCRGGQLTTLFHDSLCYNKQSKLYAIQIVMDEYKQPYGSLWGEIPNRVKPNLF